MDRPGMLNAPLPALDDAEGARVPAGLPPIVDAHVHVFPAPIFAAVRGWFDEHGWPIRYRMDAAELLRFLTSRGVAQVVAVQYAHKPGIARELNRFMVELCRDVPGVTGLATVFPGEPEAGAILREAFDAGLAGVKLHCHVQCVPPDAPEMDPVYRACVESGRPLLHHVGREPKSPAYACDPHAICSADRVDRVMRRFPGLKLCVPHLGADEYDGYGALLDRHPGLWLDTAMTLADYFPGPVPWSLVEAHHDRILYGSDFPNIPYAWDRELRRIVDHGFAADTLAALLGGNASRLYGLHGLYGLYGLYGIDPAPPS